MHIDSIDIFGPYARLMSAFGATELLKDIKKVSTDD